VSDPADGPGSDPAEESTPVRRAIELLLFAPVGVAVTVAEDLPALIVKGRQRFETDVRNARLIGRFVVEHGQRDLVRRVGKLLHNAPSAEVETEAADPSASAAARTATAPGPTAATPGPTPTSAVPGHAAAATASAAPTASASPKPAPDPADALVVEGALAGYDTLSASQVVRRLESLGPDELRAVHRHEASHRNRRTILNRAQQLLEGPVG
jgi:hypothetical protein